MFLLTRIWLGGRSKIKLIVALIYFKLPFYTTFEGRAKESETVRETSQKCRE